MARVAVLGMGTMGSRLARSLVAGGHAVSVWSRSGVPADLLADETGPVGWAVADTPAQAATGAEVVLVVVRDDVASQAVWSGASGAFAAMTPGALAVDCSTLTVERSDAFVAEARTRGLAAVVAPLVGSKPQAEAGALTFLVGGEADDRARAVALLAPVGASAREVGNPADAAVLKLAINASLAVQTALMAELDAALAARLSPGSPGFEAVRDLPVFSPAALGMLARMRAGQDAPNFTVALMAKDLDYFLGLVDSGDAPTVERAREIYLDAARRGLGARDLSAVRQLRQ
ncbi:MAG TPA: NAD(P)-dependent oxidoreductase [Candidatus Nanopelagicales bacterium]